MTGRIFSLALAWGMALSDIAAAEAGSVESGILSHETVVGTRQPQRVTPVRLAPGGRVLVLPSAVGPSGPTAPDDGDDADDADGADEAIDVYALSPHARLLALPRMVAPTYAERLRAGQAPPEWDAIIAEAHDIFGLDEALIASVIRVESGFRATAESSAGAQGAMQIMPDTQVELGLIDPFDARANVYAGAQYLREQLDRFGRLDLALAAYNAGPGAVKKHGGVPPFSETREFVRKVLEGL